MAILVMDVGGSFIKYALTDEEGRLLEETVGETSACADQSADKVLDTFGRIIRWAKEKTDITSACACFPGPFDFDRGVSGMKHKFQAMYGRSVLPPFEAEGLKVSFVHDSTAYMLGVCREEILLQAQKPCCIMLGTGLGFAMMENGRVLIDEKQTPAFSLWNAPFEDGTAEDRVSTRAIMGLYNGVTAVKEIAALAREGDEKALAAFHIAGASLSDIVTKAAQRFGLDALSLGGQIARSADLLHLHLPIPWQVTTYLSDAALRGAAYCAINGKENCTKTIAKMYW